MSTYVDGFLIPIKKANLKPYKKMAKLGCKVWMEYGALDYYECVCDDMKEGFGLSFKKLCKLKSNETVVFAFIVYKSKADRNRINKLVMADPRMNKTDAFMKSMPFDLKRFSVAGFKTMVAK